MSPLPPKLFFLLTLPHLLPLTTAAQQDPLSHLSALFTNPPAAATPTPCCAATCAPQACNIHLPAAAGSDLAYLFPLPTTTPSPAAAKVSFPCCGPACPDGGCRASPGMSSERPASATGKPPGGPAARPGLVGGGEDSGGEVNVIIGCCRGCKGCKQSAGAGEGTAVEMAFKAQVTDPAEAQARVGGGAGDDGEGRGPPGGSGGEGGPPHFVQPPLQPGHPQIPGICIGCAAGVCSPCPQRAFATAVAFTPGVGGQTPPEATATTTREGVGSEEPEPTMLMGADVADAVKGVNQDMVPVVVQSFGFGVEKGEWELMTLLATVDLKVQDNYLSKRVVEALGLGDKVLGFKKGTGKLAVLTGLLEPVVVDGYLDLQIVTGSRSATTGDHGADNEGHWQLLRGVRWYVHSQDEGGESSTPDVILGTKALSEVGGLSLVNSVRKQVQGGVKVLGVGHFLASAEAREAKEDVKDEL